MSYFFLKNSNQQEPLSPTPSALVESNQTKNLQFSAFLFTIFTPAEQKNHLSPYFYCVNLIPPKNFHNFDQSSSWKMKKLLRRKGGAYETKKKNSNPSMQMQQWLSHVGRLVYVCLCRFHYHHRHYQQQQ